MGILHAIILGIVQGITELLPISSSAHLILVKWLFDIEASKAFDVALHFGTLLAIGLFFFKDWLKLITAGIANVKGKRSKEGFLFWYIVIATIPGGLVGFLLEKFAGDFLEDKYLIIAIALIVMGIVLYVVDKNFKPKTDYNHLTLKQTFIIGCSQALAFIPGVSRSGVTITTGRYLGVDRESAAKFSFMLSAPIVLAATIFKLKDFVFNAQFIIGVLISFLVGIFVIKFLLDYLKKGSFKAFAIYRVIIRNSSNYNIFYKINNI